MWPVAIILGSREIDDQIKEIINHSIRDSCRQHYHTDISSFKYIYIYIYILIYSFFL